MNTLLFHDPRYKRLLAALAAIIALLGIAVAVLAVKEAKRTPDATFKDERGVEAVLRDYWQTMRVGRATREQVTHYCTDLLTEQDRASLPFCNNDHPKQTAYVEQFEYVENIVITGETATATVWALDLLTGIDRHSDMRLTWEEGSWRVKLP